MGMQSAARAFCSGSALPALLFCPYGLCLAKNAAGLRAAVMSVEMLQVHVDGQVSSVRWSWNKQEGHADADLLWCLTSVW
eukprot:3940005-Rhodomonas_salina.1